MSFVRMMMCSVALLAPANWACSSDTDTADGGSGGSGGNGGGGGGDGGSAGSGAGSACARGCELTLAEQCSKGPPSQQVCEADCEALLAGDCGKEYEAYMSCADGEELSCSGAGYPQVTACAAEQATFVDCLNP